MIRAAAKNHAAVTVVVDPEDYARVLAEHCRATAAPRRSHLRKALAAKAYARTAAYDAAISGWFASDAGRDGAAAGARSAAGSRRSCATARTRTSRRPSMSRASARPGVATAVQHQGKELSYNNLNDTDAAFELVAEFDPKTRRPSPSSSTPTRAASRSARTLAEAYAKALRCDPVSAFGGIVALNGPIDAATAREIARHLHRGGDRARRRRDEAKAIFAAKKNLRLLTTGGLPDPRAQGAHRSARWPAASWCSRATTPWSRTWS